MRATRLKGGSHVCLARWVG